MNLTTALSYIAHTFNLNPIELDMASQEDPHGGYNSAYEDGFPTGSLWRVEGQFLYALIRALHPDNVLELGTWHGASATHLLQGIVDNKHGGLTCIDSNVHGSVEIGGMIPKALKPLAFLKDMRIETFVPQAVKEGWTYDFIFEDGMHDAAQVAFVWKHADLLLNPGGMIVSHDAMHSVAGEAVRDGIQQAGYGERTVNVLIEPADCGFAVWRKAL